MKAFMSTGVERGGDGTGTLLSHTRADEALAEARRIVAETESAGRHWMLPDPWGATLPLPHSGGTVMEEHRLVGEAQAALADALRAWLETPEP